MLSVTLVDHLRLTFGHVVHRHRAHARLAHARAQRSRWLLGAEAILIAAAALASTAAVFTPNHVYVALSAVAGILALLTLLGHLTFDLDASAKAHGASASRLWLIRERYRALLSDLADGAIDLEIARRRRDVLMDDLHAIYENAPPMDQPSYQTAAQAVTSVDEGAMGDEEIDMFLPESLQKAKRAS